MLTVYHEQFISSKKEMKEWNCPRLKSATDWYSTGGDGSNRLEKRRRKQPIKPQTELEGAEGPAPQYRLWGAPTRIRPAPPAPPPAAHKLLHTTSFSVPCLLPSSTWVAHKLMHTTSFPVPSRASTHTHAHAQTHTHTHIHKITLIHIHVLHSKDDYICIPIDFCLYTIQSSSILALLTLLGDRPEMSWPFCWDRV
jgi:hypothetical protein